MSLAHPAISVVVPMRNEGPNVEPLLREIALALDGVAHEILCIDDGSTDDTAAELERMRAAGLSVRPLRHRRSCGQSAGVVTGVRAARAPWIATLDGDGQNDPADIPKLWRRAQAEINGAAISGAGLDGSGINGAQAGGTGAAGALERVAGAATAVEGAASGPGAILVAGWRTTRRDTTVKRLSSRIANRVRARLLGDATPDTGCGLKVFPRALFLALPPFDHMHRFLPALVIRQGGRVVSEPVNHRPRTRGVSNYGTLDRLAVGLVDLLGVMWLQRRWKRPELLPEAPGTLARPVEQGDDVARGSGLADAARPGGQVSEAVGDAARRDGLPAAPAPANGLGGTPR
ncbi:glycosyltransferase family 2 protein [Roseomonas elaeocarpi]|uniref:Glycosyltransferase family 2 protein n=1 Tax=Roseomonas elaeocarpi TaxID=907779 RepID=A0ABV6JY22_9PROT